MKQLKLADKLSLPADAVTQTISILAKRRVGKSYAARRFAEQLFNAGQQIVIVDPKGDWWGIRSAADGKSPGLPVAILGGERGDVPLEVGSGEIVAKLAAEERVSMLLDLSLFSKRQLATFMTDFLEHLYRIKARELYRTPLMLIIDEADAIAPQKPQDNEARMLGAAEDIVRRGGQRGLGCILVTQRSAVLNKNVLTQSEMIVALRTISPQDLKAMDEWIDVHGTREQRATLMSSLPSLPVGDAWFWSPGWPTEDGIFQRVHVLPIETFDSGASPKPGEKRVEPKNVADVDLGALTRQMAATIEKAKATDPKLLQQQIAGLKRELATRAVIVETKETKVVDPAVIERAVARALADVRKKSVADATRLRRTLARINATFRELLELLDSAIASLDIDFIEGGAVAPVSQEPNRTVPAAPIRPVERVRPAPRELRPPAEGLSGAQQKILNAIATLNELGVEQPTLVQVALFVGISHTTGSYLQNVRDLGDTGYLDRHGKGGNTSTTLTAAGKNSAQADVDRDPIEFWKQKLPGAQSKLLSLILEHAPISREKLAEKAGVLHTTGSYQQNLRDMRTYGIIEIESGSVSPSPLLSPLAYV